jgi:hypothetical protein
MMRPIEWVEWDHKACYGWEYDTWSREALEGMERLRRAHPSWVPPGRAWIIPPALHLAPFDPTLVEREIDRILEHPWQD